MKLYTSKKVLLVGLVASLLMPVGTGIANAATTKLQYGRYPNTQHVDERTNQLSYWGFIEFTPSYRMVSQDYSWDSVDRNKKAKRGWIRFYIPDRKDGGYKSTELATNSYDNNHYSRGVEFYDSLNWSPNYPKTHFDTHCDHFK